MISVNLMGIHQSKYIYCKNEKLNKYLVEKCIKYNANVKIDGKLINCNAVNYFYKGRYNIIVSGSLTDKETIFAILHELSHIDLNYIGKNFEKKSYLSIKEKIVNINLIYKNRNIIKNNIYLLIVCAMLSENVLFKMITFRGLYYV